MPSPWNGHSGSSHEGSGTAPRLAGPRTGSDRLKAADAGRTRDVQGV